MAIYTVLPRDEARAIGKRFGLDVATAEGLTAGSVNSNVRLTTTAGAKVFLRIYEEQSEAGAAQEAELLEWLAAHEIKAPMPMTASDGSRLTSYAGKPVALFPWLPGEMRCQRAVSIRDTFEVGRALARVHTVGAPRARESRFSPAKLIERCDVIETATDPKLARMAPILRERLAEVIAARSEHATRGLCHGDLFRDNVLWVGDSLSALLDFESAADGPFAFDLAVTMLAWTYGDDFVPDLARGLFDGYRSVRPLAREDREALYAEARLAALRFTTTRITDYAMRAHLGANNPRDYLRFWRRYERLGDLGASGLREMLGIEGDAE